MPAVTCAARRIALALWLLVSVSAVQAQAMPDDTSTAQATLHWQPPGFSLQQVDGSPFRYPEDLTGPTIVLFWATWCPYCKALMPHLQSILVEYPGRVKVLALSIHDDGDPAAVLAEYGFDFTLFTAADEVAKAWDVKGTPGLFLADASGAVIFDLMRLPAAAQQAPTQTTRAPMKHYQNAARNAPYWAAKLRLALDLLQP